MPGDVLMSVISLYASQHPLPDGGSFRQETRAVEAAVPAVVPRPVSQSAAVKPRQPRPVVFSCERNGDSRLASPFQLKETAHA